jgi:hypothetical protein
VTAPTYLTMQTRISDELGARTDLTAQIKLAIQTAIQKWEREPFYFNELNDVNGFSTTSGQEFYGATTTVSYSLISTLAKIDKIHVLVSQNRYSLNPRTWQYMEDIGDNPSNIGQPVDFCYFAEQLRFYPIPDGTYPVTMSGVTRLTALSADADTNAWMQDAEALIRCEAKADLYINLLQNAGMAQAMQAAIYGNPGIRGDRGYLSALKGETTRRGAGGRIRPSMF